MAIMRILFVGESWRGSCARSIKEALIDQNKIYIDEVSEESCYKFTQNLFLKLIHRLFKPLYRREFNRSILHKIRSTKPDIFMVYKGYTVASHLIQEIKKLGVKTVNIYPDCSPSGHGVTHQKAVGQYDLVISTKIFHPALWHNLYSYKNRCVFVPQGYDPALHYFNDIPSFFKVDIVLIATFRVQYGDLMIEFAKKINDREISVTIGGYGWDAIRKELPQHWHLTGAVSGHEYVSLLRSAKICIAPLHEHQSEKRLGDVDTTRTYELAAANCFFIHRRTEFVEQLYQGVGLPLFDSAAELADITKYYLTRDDERKKITELAHHKAVPAYSTHARAAEIVSILKQELL